MTELDDLYGPALARLRWEEHGGPYAPPARPPGAERCIPVSHNDTEWRTARHKFNRTLIAGLTPDRTAGPRPAPKGTHGLNPTAVDHPPGTTVVVVPVATADEVRAFIPDGLVAIRGTGLWGYLYAIVDQHIIIDT